jgi:hypothetical protein
MNSHACLSGKLSPLVCQQQQQKEMNGFALPHTTHTPTTHNMAEWQDMFGDDNSDSSGDEEEKETMDGAPSGDVHSKDLAVHSKQQVPNMSPYVIKQIPGIGGMRGVFAAEDLPAGTLILAECPVYTWKGHFSDVSVLRSTVTGICSSDKAYAATKSLHPFVLADADEEEIATMRDLWGETLALAVTDLNSLRGSEINADEVLRVSIALQHNAYGSGFYQIFSLVNHTCAPNCTKLCPTTDKGWRRASEIWTNRDVQKGEELTICYNHIREMTNSSIAKFLHEHHRFQCNCPIHSVESNPQSVFSCEPRVDKESSGDLHTAEEETTTLVDDWSSVLQERVEYYEEQLERFSGGGAEDKNKDLDVLFDIITVCGEILSEMVEYLNEFSEHFSILKHVMSGFLMLKENQLVKPGVYVNTSDPMREKERDGMYMMVRLHKIIVSAASVSIEELGKKEALLQAKNKSDMACKVFEKLVWASEQYLTHALAVAPLQLYYLGHSHPDIAQTFLDIAEGISCAFSLNTEAAKYATTLAATKHLSVPQDVSNRSIITTEEANILRRVYVFNPEKYGWAQSSKLAQQMMENIRKEGNRVANLYKPRYDVVQERLVAMSLEMPDAYQM